MHVEVQIAVNFLISFLYNKLPRRRVNQFGEELETALKAKYEDHWYPNEPCKGSAFRCIRCTPPLDPIVFEMAANNSGMNLVDIRENLPQDLSIWVDPGEVSYRSGEKGQVKILYTYKTDLTRREFKSELNPKAKCFKPTEPSVLVTPNMSSPPPPPPSETQNAAQVNNNNNNKPVVFTTAAFAATKFGSTKLKNLNKKGPRHLPADCHNSAKYCQASTQYSANKSFGRDQLNHDRVFQHGKPTHDNQENHWPNVNPPTDFWASEVQAEKFAENLNFNFPYESPSNAELAVNLFSGLKFESPNVCSTAVFSEDDNARFEPFWGTKPVNTMDTWETNQFPFLNDTIWNDILNGEDSVAKVTEMKQTDPSNGVGNNEAKVYSGSSFSSTMSSPSLSTSNESNLVNEFDCLSLNSSGSLT